MQLPMKRLKNVIIFEIKIFFGRYCSLEQQCCLKTSQNRRITWKSPFD